MCVHLFRYVEHKLNKLLIDVFSYVCTYKPIHISIMCIYIYVDVCV